MGHERGAVGNVRKPTALCRKPLHRAGARSIPAQEEQNMMDRGIAQ